MTNQEPDLLIDSTVDSDSNTKVSIPGGTDAMPGYVSLLQVELPQVAANLVQQVVKAPVGDPVTPVPVKLFQSRQSHTHFTAGYVSFGKAESF